LINKFEERNKKSVLDEMYDKNTAKHFAKGGVNSRSYALLKIKMHLCKKHFARGFCALT
jgi:hypothetical protein